MIVAIILAKITTGRERQSSTAVKRAVAVERDGQAQS